MKIPFFEPLHPAVRIHCNFCGAHIQTETYLTEKVRNVMTMERHGDYVFCEICGDRAADLIEKVNTFRATMAAKLNEEIEVSVLEYAATLVPTHFPTQVQPDDAQGKKGKPAKRQRMPGEIPQPPNVNG